jgi:hypothetical protein
MSARHADLSPGGHRILAGTRGVIPMPGGHAGPMSAHPPGTMPRLPLDPLTRQRPGHGSANPECRR